MAHAAREAFQRISFRELVPPPLLEVLRISQKVLWAGHGNGLHIEAAVDALALQLQAGDFESERLCLRIIGRIQLSWLKREGAEVLGDLVAL